MRLPSIDLAASWCKPLSRWPSVTHRHDSAQEHRCRVLGLRLWRKQKNEKKLDWLMSYLTWQAVGLLGMFCLIVPLSLGAAQSHFNVVTFLTFWLIVTCEFGVTSFTHHDILTPSDILTYGKFWLLVTFCLQAKVRLIVTYTLMCHCRTTNTS